MRRSDIPRSLFGTIHAYQQFGRRSWAVPRLVRRSKLALTDSIEVYGTDRTDKSFL